MKKWWILKGLKYLLFGIVAVLLFGTIVMMLWNWLIPDIFHGPEITFMEALGVLVLSKILFGGFKGGGCCGGGHHHYKKHSGYWRKKWEKKMANMTPEEREKYKHCFESKYGWGDDPCDDLDSENKQTSIES